MISMAGKAIRRWWALFALPTFAAFIIGFLVPFIMGVYLSFCEFTTVTDGEWVGLKNYGKALKDKEFLHALGFSTAFTIVTTIVINVIAFAIAYMLTKAIKGSTLFRSVFFMPNLIGGIILGYIWLLLLNGVLAHWGRALTYKASYGFWGLVILVCWQQIGYMMIIYIAGLQALPTDVLEAAAVDGANGRQTMFRIIIPLMMPSITVCSFLTVTNGFKLYDQNLALTNGAPSNMSEGLALNITRTFYGRMGWEGVGRAVLHPGRGHRPDSEQAHHEQGGGSLMNENKPVKHGALWTVLFAVVSLFWIFPIVLVLINSFKQKAYISKNAFSLPAGKAFVGLENYVRGIETTQFFASFGWTLLITVGSVALILVCTSMCAWWIVRVNNWAAKLLYTLFLFNMIVPFQMVMFTLSKIADMLKLNTPWGLCIVYLGFGAGLAVFIFTGVIKGIPQELEESAMIDGASVPRIFFQIVVPIMKPSIVSVAILEAMWIWNDYLLPYLTLDLGKYKTVSVAVQYLKGGYGSVDMGAMMACLVLAIIPIIVFYLVCQKYIVSGVMAGAVKG